MVNSKINLISDYTVHKNIFYISLYFMHNFYLLPLDYFEVHGVPKTFIE